MTPPPRILSYTVSNPGTLPLPYVYYYDLAHRQQFLIL